MASRRQSIRTRIILLLAVPFAALLGLWAVAASSSLGDALLLLKAKAFQDKLVLPAQALVTGLQDERRLSTAYLGSLSPSDHLALEQQRATTDTLRVNYRSGAASPDLNGIQRGVRTKADDLSSRLSEIDTMRQTVDANVVSRGLVMAEYSSLIDDAFGIYNAVQPGNAEMYGQARTLTSLARAREMLAREDALVAGVLAKGKMTDAERDQIALLSGTQQTLYHDTVPLLSDADQRRFQQIHDGADLVRFRSLETSMIDVPVALRGHGSYFLPVSLASWNDSSKTVVKQLYDFENQALDSVIKRAWDIAVGVLLKLTLTAGLGLVAVVLSVVVAVRAGRRIIREARTLAGTVEVFSRDQLPVLAERVSRGELIEEDGAGVAGGQRFTVTEIDKLSAAFDAAQTAVVRAARSEAAARKGVNDLFINLARRNQALLHRQLGLLDSMERRVEDPQELDDLFRLDHLATCMRRHAEGLVILAGKNAGRSWRTPVPIVDVARGAVAEVEDYTRVQVMPMPRAALTGAAVADTIHLLAELVENAVMFSPPDAPVRLTGQLLPNGLVLEVEDRGLGMSPELLAELNGRLAEVPEFDLFDSARLGTFVVSRLAARHGIKVSLSASPYGGTTAIVLLPADLIVTGPQAAIEPPQDQEAVHVPEQPESALNGNGPSSSFRPPVFRTSAPPDPNDTHLGLPRRRKAAAPAPAADEQLGLPKRHRQTSLAPQLRETSGNPPGPARGVQPVADAATPRSPEEVRSMMSAMQRGWQQGRTTAERPAISPEEDSR